MSENSKVYSGDQIKGLFSRPQSVPVTIESEKFGKITFDVRPMTNGVYAEMGEAMKSSGVDPEKANNVEALKIFSTVYYPAIQVVFPACCVNPKVVKGQSTKADEISLDDIPIDVCMSLFNQIMNISGFSDDKAEKRKN